MRFHLTERLKAWLKAAVFFSRTQHVLFLMGSWKARSTGDESLVVKEQAREKSIQQFLKAPDGGQNKVITAANYHTIFLQLQVPRPKNIAFSHKILLRFLLTIQKL